MLGSVLATTRRKAGDSVESLKAGRCPTPACAATGRGKMNAIGTLPTQAVPARNNGSQVHPLVHSGWLYCGALGVVLPNAGRTGASRSLMIDPRSGAHSPLSAAAPLIECFADPPGFQIDLLQPPSDSPPAASPGEFF